jgi:hypothetical protein
MLIYLSNYSPSAIFYVSLRDLWFSAVQTIKKTNGLTDFVLPVVVSFLKMALEGCAW